MSDRDDDEPPEGEPLVHQRSIWPAIYPELLKLVKEHNPKLIFVCSNLGQLFRSSKFQRDETELVVTLTPILARTAEPAALAMPTDGFGPANDAGLFFLEQLYTTYRGPGPRPTGTLKGPVGFVLE